MEGGMSDTIEKGNHPMIITTKFGFLCFNGIRGEDLNVIFYQYMQNLQNQNKSFERKISLINPECMLNYSLACNWG